jgi:hypothetical protein
VQVYQGFDPFSFMKSTTPKLPSNSEEQEQGINQLSSILLEDEQIMINKTGRLPALKPRWPITTTRDEHGDNDVFIARANNPFGHSTKWKYR